MCFYLITVQFWQINDKQNKGEDQEGPSFPVILALLPASDDIAGSTQLGREDWSIIVLSTACQPILDPYILCCAGEETELTYYSLIYLGF